MSIWILFKDSFVTKNFILIFESYTKYVFNIETIINSSVIYDHQEYEIFGRARTSNHIIEILWFLHDTTFFVDFSTIYCSHTLIIDVILQVPSFRTFVRSHCFRLIIGMCWFAIIFWLNLSPKSIFNIRLTLVAEALSKVFELVLSVFGTYGFSLFVYSL